MARGFGEGTFGQGTFGGTALAAPTFELLAGRALSPWVVGSPDHGQVLAIGQPTSPWTIEVNP